MATVDPTDDNIKRYVVRRYGYDPERHERRHQVVAAFDNEREFIDLIEAQKDEIDRRRGAGEELSALDYYSGVVLEAGYRHRMALQRLVWKATERGVSLPTATLGRVDWQPGTGFFWSVTKEPGYGGKER
jgi:hypothetical protein